MGTCNYGERSGDNVGRTTTLNLLNRINSVVTQPQISGKPLINERLIALRPYQIPRVDKIIYKKGELIEEGTFSNLYQGLSLNTGEIIALHFFKFQIGENIIDIENEIMLEKERLKDIKHENIVIVKDIQVDKDEKCVVIITEFVSGCSISEIIKRFGALEEKIVLAYLIQILNAIIYLHSKKYYFGNIKSSNILIDSGGVLKITGYIHIKTFEAYIQKYSINSNESYNFIIPPEFITNSSVSEESDIWQLGILLIEMLSGKELLSDKKIISMKNICAKEMQTFYLQNMPAIPCSITNILADSIKDCLNINKNLRPKLAELNEIKRKIKVLSSLDVNEIRGDILKMITTIKRSRFGSIHSPTIENRNKIPKEEDCFYKRLGTLVVNQTSQTIEFASNDEISKIQELKNKFSASISKPFAPPDNTQNNIQSNNIENAFDLKNNKNQRTYLYPIKEETINNPNNN